MDATNSSMVPFPAVPPVDPEKDEPTNPGACRCAPCDERRALELAMEREGVEVATIVRRRDRFPPWRVCMSTAENPMAIGDGHTEPEALQRALANLRAR